MVSLRASLVADRLVFHDGSELELPSNAIVIVTGPNNAGKSTLLEEIYQQYKYYGLQSYKGLILKSVSNAMHGEFEDFIGFLDEGDFYDKEDESYEFQYGKSYKRKTLETAWQTASLPSVIFDLFSVKLEPKDTISTPNQYARSRQEKDPIDHLWDSESEEVRISSIFSRAFGTDLILDRHRGGGRFKIGDRAKLPPHKKRFTKDFRSFMDDLPNILKQGDGMRSFASIALELLTARKSITVIDEPELFLLRLELDNSLV